MSDAYSLPPPSGQAEYDERLLLIADVATLEGVMAANLGFTLPDVRRAIARFGAGRCERAYFKTMSDDEDGGIRSPRGWFLSTLIKGMEWTVEEATECLPGAKKRLAK